MATDFSKPTVTDNYAALLPALQVTINDLAKGLEPTASGTHTNVPTNAIRWNATSSYWEKFNGTSWAALSSLFAINVSGNAGNVTGTVAVANGGTGSTSAAAARTALAVAASGANVDLTSLSALASINGGALAGLRNRIINGDMRIDQRNDGSVQTIFGGTGGFYSYTLDRWYVGTGGSTASNVTIQRVAGTAPYLYALQFSNASALTTGSYSLEQRIEAMNCLDLVSQNVTLQFQAKAGWSTSITATVYVPNTADTFNGSQVQIATQTFTISTTAAIYSMTFNAGSAAANGIRVVFSVAYAAFSGVIFTISGVQMELGSVATTFERRHLGLEMLLCQRYAPSFWGYYYSSGVATSITNFCGWGYTTGTASGVGVLPFAVKARVPVTGFVLSGLYNLNVQSPGGSGTGNFAFTGGGIDGALVSWSSFIGGSTGTTQPCYLSLTGSATRLVFTGAEL